jgi:hypothetical protein
MGSMDSLQIFQSLGPDDLRMAASAFDAALRSVDESSSATDPYSVRQALAKFMMESRQGFVAAIDIRQIT